MDVIQEIKQYIEMNETPGVLLLTGAWGCGKSHLMKNIAEDYNCCMENAEPGNKRSRSTIVLISLFGIDSIPDLDKAVKKEILQCKYRINEKMEKTTKKAFSGAGSLIEMVGTFIPAFSAAKPLMSVNLLDFIDITNKVGDKQLVLVFDDFERSKIERDILLGYINDLSENKQIKVIIIADETKIQDDQCYKDYKEKIICRTIQLVNDYNILICQIIEAYNETEPNYKCFLRTNVNILQQVFAESGKNNIRILKYILADFERIYAAWISTDVSRDNLPFVLYTFAAEYYIKRQPSKEEPQEEKNNLLFSYAGKENGQYSLKGSHKSSLYSISDWINSGSWDENQFKTELLHRYGKVELSPEQAFLCKNFWDLTQIEIEHGLPNLVNHAYDGLLSHDELITLIQKIHWLKDIGFSLPCDVDYNKIETGLWTRFEAIKKNEIIEPHITSFADTDSIDEEAKTVNAFLEQMDDYICVFQNRKALLEYLSNPKYLNRHRFKSQIFCEFDDEVRNAFLTSYSKADNGIKRELAQCLISIDFYSSDLSRKEMIECSLKNYSLIIAELQKESHFSTDSMERMIRQLFIVKINERLSELNERIKVEE